MVNNQVIDYIKSELGRSISPYINESVLEDDEAQKLFEDFSYETGLEDFDALILHGAPSEEENGLRYDLFAKAAFYLQASGNNPKMFVPENFRDDIEASNDINSSSVEYLDPDITEDEISQAYEKFRGNGRIHITSDYHAEGVDHLSTFFDEDDFVVLSADTSEEDYPKEDYTDILGSLSGPASKLPASWRFWAEGKEAGRKLTDWKRGPRF
ncbi:MAG: hypothetical protein V5A72_01960 [Candidatus Nanohaloarchaea archaeon]